VARALALTNKRRQHDSRLDRTRVELHPHPIAIRHYHLRQRHRLIYSRTYLELLLLEYIRTYPHAPTRHSFLKMTLLYESTSMEVAPCTRRHFSLLYASGSLGGGWYLSLAFGQHLKPSVDAVVYRSKTTNQPVDDEDKMATRLHALRGHLAAADNAFTVKGSCICGTVTYSAEQSGSALKIIYCKVHPLV
jgi:hypothetical protein